MRDKSAVWIVAAVALVAGLIGLNLAMRTDPEPDFQPPSRRAAPPRADEPPAEAEPEPAAAPEEASTEAEAEAEPDPDEAAEDSAEPSSDEPSAACDHPFVPSTAGDWRRYRWQQTGEARAAVMRIEALRARELPSGERAVTWRVEVTAQDDGSDLGQAEMTTRCRPGERAEEPWFGVLERSLGLTMTDAPGRWRWPARLRAGARFEGTATFDPTGADMRRPADVQGPQQLRVTRRHVVIEREHVTVPAGRFRAWRVDYEEQHAFGERGERGTGTVWVAPDVGMIKTRAENSRGVVQTIELLAFGRGS